MSAERFKQLLIKAEALANAKEHEKEAEVLTQVIEMLPYDAGLYYLRARSHMAIPQWAAAKKDLDNALRFVHPFPGEVYYCLGVCDLNLNNDAQAMAMAMAHFTKALRLELKPYSRMGALFNRARLYYVEGQFDEAIADLSDLITLSPDLPEPWRYRGLCHQEKGDLPKAISDFKQHVTRNPSNADGHRLLAQSNFTAGNTEAAIFGFREVISLNHEDVDAYAHLGECYMQNGALDRAINAVNEAIRRDPNHAGAHSCKGECLMRQGQLDHALAFLDRALHLKPESLNTLICRAECHAKRGDGPQSMSDIMQAMRLEPDLPKLLDPRRFLPELKVEDEQSKLVENLVTALVELATRSRETTSNVMQAFASMSMGITMLELASYLRIIELADSDMCGLLQNIENVARDASLKVENQGWLLPEVVRTAAQGVLAALAPVKALLPPPPKADKSTPQSSKGKREGKE